VLYELASLRRAFDGGSLPALVVKILRGRYPPLPGRYSPQLRGLVDALLQQDPQVRLRMSGGSENPVTLLSANRFLHIAICCLFRYNTAHCWFKQLAVPAEWSLCCVGPPLLLVAML
jgi:hypothetical protein